MKTQLLLSYDGTRFAGWQIQPNGTSVQELLEKALSTLLRTPTKVSGSGRTDAGVHAHEQSAHFTHEEPLPDRCLRSLNGLLPTDIRVHSHTSVADDFHARYSATGKIYHYHIWLEPTHSPFHRLYSLHHPYAFDRHTVEEATHHLIGTHDFTSFANAPTEGAVAKNPVRTLKRLDLVEQEGGLRLEFEADGFLYKMVRNLVGTLLDVASEKITPHDIGRILEARDRRQAAQPAKAHGLFLTKVHYST